jgi:hypothetical protein
MRLRKTMSLLRSKDCLNTELILSSETTPSVISQNFPMPLGMFMILSRSLSLESRRFHSNEFTVMMNFWLSVLNHSSIKIALAFMHCSATLQTILGPVRKSASACSTIVAGTVTERESKGQIDSVFSNF